VESDSACNHRTGLFAESYKEPYKSLRGSKVIVHAVKWLLLYSSSFNNLFSDEVSSLSKSRKKLSSKPLPAVCIPSAIDLLHPTGISFELTTVHRAQYWCSRCHEFESCPRLKFCFISHLPKLRSQLQYFFVSLNVFRLLTTMTKKCLQVHLEKLWFVRSLTALLECLLVTW